MTDERTFKTKSMHEAAVLMAQTQFQVSYIELEPLPNDPKKFKFVLSYSAEQKVFNQFRNDYMNQRVLIEPKTYDAKLNILRDNLAISKG